MVIKTIELEDFPRDIQLTHNSSYLLVVVADGSIKKLDMRGILDLCDYETATIVSEEDFIKRAFKGNMAQYAMMSARDRTTLIRRNPEIERLVIEYRGKFIQVDIKAVIYMGD